jgi:hypothetical protein
MGDTDTKPCPDCNGDQWIRIDNLTSKPCGCLQGFLLRQHLGSALATAPKTRSPLFVPPSVDRTEENLFLKGSWTDLLPHFRWTLGCKYNLDTSHSFLITTDERLLQVWLGSESYTQRSRSKRDEVDTYNNLADLVNGPRLLIIRLGFLGYPNKAAPGVLKQALGIREVSLKPTWLIEEPSSVFGHGHHTHSDEVESYILEHFDIIDLRGSARSEASAMERPRGYSAAPIPTTDLANEDEDTVSMGPGPTMTVSWGPKPEERIRVPADSMLPGESREGKFKPGAKKKSGGGLGGMGI